METFRQIVNDCIRTGLQNNVSSMKQLSKLIYKDTAKYNIVNYYRLCAISKAAGILANRKKSMQRGHNTRTPYMKKPLLLSCYGFKIIDGVLKVPLGNKQYFDIQLNNHTKQIIDDPAIKVRSFLLTPNSVSICYSKKVEEYIPKSAIGIDRNLANITVGNSRSLTQYNLAKAVDIAENNRSVMRAFRRCDSRIAKRLWQKHGQRRRNRVNQLLHKISKIIVQQAKQQKAAIVFEDIRHIRGLYLRGNFQGRDRRFKMNSWPYYELKRQIEYKAAWEGIPVIQLTKCETRGTSKLCPRCGKTTQVADRIDVQHRRQLWCEKCKRWMDRDVVAAMNIAYRGWSFLAKSKNEFIHPKGLAGEAMVQESGSEEPVILKVDASKLT